MKKLVFLLTVVFCFSLAHARQGPGKSMKILAAATTTGAGTVYKPWGSKRTFQCQTAAGTATVLAQVSNDNTNFILAGTMTLSSSADGFALDAAWRYVRVNVTALVGATVDCWLGTE